MSTKHIRLTATTTLAALAATLAAIGPASPTSAANFTVDTLSDNPADGLTLREAVFLANGTPGADQITFVDGLTGTITLTSGQLTSTGDLEIVGPGREDLIIDADGNSRVLEASAGTDLALQDLTIANGSTIGSGGGVAAGAVDRLTIRNVTFVDNQASNQGGGLWVTNPDADLVEVVDSIFDNNRSGNAGGGLYIADVAGTGEARIEGTSFIENTSVNGNGGGAFVSVPGRSLVADTVGAVRSVATNGNAGGMWLDGGSVTATDVSLLDNQAGSNFGGATINSNTGDVEVTNSAFSGNTAADSGAGNISSAAAVRLADSIVADNTAAGLAGLQMSASGDTTVELTRFTDNTDGTIGALQVSAASGLTIDRSTFDGNQGTIIGGASAISVPTVIDSSTFSNNASGGATGTGGGFHSSGGTSVEVTDSTFTGNESREGGAIHSVGVGTVYLRHTTMVDNLATLEGGGVFVGAGGDIDLVNSIVADNSSPTFPDVNDPTLDVDHSILGDGMGIIVNPTASLFGVDPKLEPLADNGGPTLTMLPMSDSPAIDAADETALVVLPYDDQRGRLRGDMPDMGSVELFADDTQIWVPTEPARFVDTRASGETIDDMHEATGQFAAAEQRQISFAGRGDVPADAVGVIANVTAINTSGKGFITAHACENPRPNAASLNYTGGVNLGNEIILGLDGDGDACIYTSGPIDLAVDVVGYISADSAYTPVVPARYADTRDGSTTFDGMVQAVGIPGAVGEMTVPVAGRGNVPADAVAVTMYVSAVTPQGNGFVTVWDCDGPAPLVSSLNHVDNVNRGNEIVAPIGPDGDICLFTSANTHLTVDVVGFIPEGTNYTSLADQSRLLDTRASGVSVDGQFIGAGPVTGGEFIEFDVAGRAGIPGNVTTVTMNVTAITPTGTGFVTVYDCDGLPLASSLNFVSGVNGGNEIIASVNGDGKVCLFTSTTTHLSADATGFTSL